VARSAEHLQIGERRYTALKHRSLVVQLPIIGAGLELEGLLALLASSARPFETNKAKQAARRRAHRKSGVRITQEQRASSGEPNGPAEVLGREIAVLSAENKPGVGTSLDQINLIRVFAKPARCALDSAGQIFSAARPHASDRTQAVSVVARLRTERSGPTPRLALEPNVGLPAIVADQINAFALCVLT